MNEVGGKCPECHAALARVAGASACTRCSWRMRNPFRTKVGWAPSGWCETMDSAGRLSQVREMDSEACHAALYVPGLQVAVRQAVVARLRHLARVHAGYGRVVPPQAASEPLV